MRKAIVIELANAKTLRRIIVATANHLPYEGKVTIKAGQLIALKGVVTAIIREALAEYEQCSIELFGSAIYEADEAEGIAYLKSLTK